MSISAYPAYESYKASGVEWWPRTPAHWTVAPLKHGLRINNGQDHKDVLADDGYPVYGSGGQFAYASSYLHDGEAILLGRKGTIDKPLHVSGKFWSVDTMFYAVCNARLIPRFAYYFVTTIPFFYFSTSTALPSMTQDDLKNTPVSLPPLPEQRSIAAFLDNKCAKIDEAVRIKEEQIKLLRERRQILIQQAVTRGLTPDVPTKDSGIDWIGEIPAHWEVRRSKFLFKQSKELARKDDIQLSATQSYGVISQEKFESLVGRRVVKISTNLDKRKHVELNDFVISMRSFQGGLERAYATGCIRSSYVILRPDPEVNPDFFGYLLKIPRYIHALQITGNFIRDGQDLTFENFADVDLFIPPYQEQSEIADHIKRSCDRIDDAITIKENQIAKLNEYKTSLINAAVTGKIKVS
ncbi:restriction endonuclease subunit S [Vreelandella piezotolerans]|jgi:type I restriction enzyme S subunit|uniref:Restriction endonuclease subunit S n=1 Tax=Vreelandella piezotolerans TaxID=2609667 RepID=A0ABQ6XCN0_9GAMM|nr:restriction endonuclease subunit S [Halomonas piezotolerans]KAE8439771.1 restriction endonuclease subunit S [Halomonas piezotolerans]QJA23309.1 restriction endonuclease subunit S [Halomonas piezotolerans]